MLQNRVSQPQYCCEFRHISSFATALQPSKVTVRLRSNLTSRKAICGLGPLSRFDTQRPK
jgi:hypothetical protein